MFIYSIIIINFLLVIMYIVKNYRNKQKLLISLFFVFLPIIGFVIYIIANVVLKITNGKLYDRINLVKRYKFEDEVLSPDVNQELNIIPIGDAMAVSNNMEKRMLLLEQLKKDIHSSYKNILIASSDNDSETAHYVASVKMEVYNVLNQKLQNAMKAYEKNQNKFVNVQKVLNVLISLIDSKLLSIYEDKIYKNKYCDIIKEKILYNELEMNEDIIEFYDKFIVYCVELEDYEYVIFTFNKILDEYKNENMYKQILKMYYDTKQRENFEKILNKLCNSPIILSAEGVELIRFWMSERK